MAKKTTQQTNHTTQKNIEFILVRKQVKNIGIKVRNTGVVQVTAHNRVPLDYIMNLVDEKSDWIHKHLEKFKDLQNNDGVESLKTPLAYSTGEVLHYLGKEYTLKVGEVDVKNTKKVYIENDNIYLNLNESVTFEKKQQLIDKWYKEQCRAVFQEVLDEQFEVVKEFILGDKLLSKPTLKLRKMKSCWGVCHYTKSYIVLNTELIKYDMECITYVVLHELMHFRHPNHSKDFYNSLGYYIPNYKAVKNRLKLSKI